MHLFGIVFLFYFMKHLTLNSVQAKNNVEQPGPRQQTAQLFQNCDLV